MRSREDPKIRGTGNKREDDTKTEEAIVGIMSKICVLDRPMSHCNLA